MFAVVKAGGKQYNVASGDVIEINKIEGKAGDTVTLTEVLALGGKSPQFGAPLVKGASVTGEIVEQHRGEKVVIFKKKRRHNYRRKNGHRQHLTSLKILEIKA